MKGSILSKNNENVTPLISVIMPAYNVEQFIEEAITSVINQSISNWELIVIDDGSTDNTKKIVSKIAETDRRIRLLINEKNMRVARSRNRGLDVCQGEYVAFLDSDDYYEPNMLQRMVERARETKADIIYCSYALVDEQGKKVCNDFIVPKQTDFEQSLVRSVITCSSVLITHELAENNRFPTDMYHEDIAFWFQLLRNGAVARGVPEVLASYRQRTGSKTANKITSAIRRWGIYRKHLKLPINQCIGYMVRYAYYGLMKFKRI